MTHQSLGETITLEELSRHPYPLFQKLQRDEPVCWVPAFKLWMVTRREDVIEVLKDAELFTMEPQTPRDNPMEDTFGPMMLSLDGPIHKAIRDVFAEPFRARKVRINYQMLIEEIALELVEEFKSEAVVDLDKVFSDRLAIYTIVAALGLDVDDVDRFRHWYDDFAAAIGNLEGDEALRATGRQTFAQFEQVVLSQIDKLRATPNLSVLSYIVNHPEQPLTTAQIVSNMALTFFGGVETTSAMLSNTTWALLNHPKPLADVKLNPRRMTEALAESLRWESPVQAAMRFATRDVTLAGVEIKAGDKIYCMLGAANRDPSFFENPDTFDIYRPNASKHLSFAYGPHFCFGAPLALLEGEIGLNVLFEKLPKLALHPDFPTAPQGHEFRAPHTLMVTTQ